MCNTPSKEICGEVSYLELNGYCSQRTNFEKLTSPRKKGKKCSFSEVGDFLRVTLVECNF